MKRWRKGLAVFTAALIGTHSVAATALAYDVSAENTVEEIIFEENAVSPAELLLEEEIEDVILEGDSWVNDQEEELSDIVSIDEILVVESEESETEESNSEESNSEESNSESEDIDSADMDTLIDDIDGITVEETAYASEVSGDFEYELLNGSYAYIAAYLGTASEVTIPDQIDGYYIQEIGYGAFQDNTTLEKVTLNEECTVIGDYAFEGCTALDTVVFGSKTAEIQSYAFEGCTDLVSMELPDTITTIGYRAFRNCTGLTSFTYPKGIQSCGGSILQGCTGVTEITVPEGLSELPGGMFSGCTYLTTVNLPDSLQKIGTSAFEGCTGLTEIAWPENLTTIDSYAFKNTALSGELRLPDNVKKIDSHAFENCDSLTAVVYPDTLTFLGYRAFQNCDNLASANYPMYLNESGSSVYENCPKLTSITVPEGIDYLVAYSFANSELTEVILPDSLTKIGDGAFEGCTGLVSFEVPPQVTSIGAYAFAECSGIQEILLNDQLSEIGEHAFRYLRNLETITFPASVSKIGYEAFRGCTKLKTITYPMGLTSCGGSMFEDCTALKYVTVPEGVEILPANVFSDCKTLRRISLPSTLKTIETSAFNNCSALVDLVIPEGITKIPDYTFENCTSLERIWIPASVESIGYRVFKGCSALTIHGEEGSYAQAYAAENGITFRTENVQVDYVMLDGLVQDTEGNGIPDVTVMIYDTQKNQLTELCITDANGVWSCSETKDAVPYKIGFHHAEYTLEPSELFITPTGDTWTAQTVIGTKMFEGEESTASFTYEVMQGTDIRITGYEGTDEQLVIPDVIDGYMVREIGANVFRNNIQLTHVLLPTGLQKVGSYAFQGCTRLTYIGFQDECTTISGYAFDGCTSLQTINFSAGLLRVEEGAFRNCTALQSVKLPDTVQFIGYRAFRGCSALTEFGYPMGLTSASSEIFAECPKLTSITVPEGVTVLANEVFRNSKYLKEVHLPSTLTEIGSYAFADTTIEAIELPQSLKIIQERVFYNCDSLTSVILPDGLETIGYRAFGYCDNLESINYPVSLLTAGGEVFRDCPELTSITVPEGVVKLASNVFSYSSLTSVELPSTLEEIGNYAFGNCKKLVSFTIPSGVKKIGEYAFEYCTGLKSMTLPEGLEQIGSRAFQSLTGIRSLEIPDSVTSIGYRAFYNCTDLTSVNYPTGITTAGGGSLFENCKKLRTLEIPEGVTMIPGYVLNNNSGFRTILLPAALTQIGEGAFEGDAGLRKMIVPDGVTTIKANAFSGCKDLEHIWIPESVTTIGYRAFQNCPSLVIHGTEGSYAQQYAQENGLVFSTETVEINLVEISGSVKDAEDAGISGVSVLVYNVTRNEQTGIYVTDDTGAWSCADAEAGETYRIQFHHPKYAFTPEEQEITPIEETFLVDPVIGSSVFEGAEAAGTYTYEVIEGNDIRITAYTGEDAVLVMPSEIDGYTVLEIGSRVFQNNKVLTQVMLPENLKKVGDSAFENCVLLKYVGFYNECTTIGNYAFAGCTSLEEIEFPVSLLTINNQAFQGCTALKVADLPDSVQTIGYRAFRNCSALCAFGYPRGLSSASSEIFAGCPLLTSIEVPEGVTVLADYIFENCTYLKEITLPSTLQMIGDSAFRATAIPSVVLPEGLQQIKEHAFENCDGLTEMVFPESLEVLGYRAFRGCDNLEEINYPIGLTSAGGSVFDECTKLISVTVPEEVTVLTGNLFSNSEIQKVTLPSALETIGDYAFDSCGLLEEIVFPETLTGIGVYAFQDCKMLKEVSIPGSVRRISNYAFQNCSGLTSLILEEGIEEIGYRAFRNLDSITEVILPFSVQKMEGESFMSCDNLTYINYPENLTSSGSRIVADCKKLLKVTVPDSVTAIPAYAFDGCTFLREVELGSGVTSIGNYAFRDCTGLAQMILPTGVKNIENRAFSNCTSLWKITLPGSVESIHDYAFEKTDSILFVVENSYAHLYAIRRGLNYEIVPNENTDYTKYVLDMTLSSYYTTSDTVQCSSMAPLSLKYQIKAEEYQNISDLRLCIVLAQNLQLYEKSVVLDGISITDYEYENEILTVPVTAQSGTLHIYARPTQQGNVTTYAYLSYKKDKTAYQDLIGVIDLNIPILTLDIPSVLSGDSLMVQGVTTGKENVCFTVNGEAAGMVTARRDGQYSTRLALPKFENGASVKIRAYLESDPTIYIERAGVFQGETPKLVEFTMFYNAHSSRSLDLLALDGRASVSLFPGYPFTFRIRFEHGEDIREVNVVSTKNGVTKTLKAESTAVPGLFLASGYFDPENHSYVPGNISLSYKFHSEIENITTSLDQEDLIAGRPECWDTAKVENLTEKNEGNKKITNTTVSMADAYGTQLDVTKTVITHKNVNVPQYLAKNGYRIVTDEVGNRAAVKVEYNGSSLTESYINLEDPDVFEDFAESFIEEVVHIKIIKGPEDFDKILFKDMPIIEGIGYVFEYKAMVDQVNSANMTEAERAAAREQLDTIRDYYSAKLVVSYIAAVAPIILGITFPASLAVTAVALLAEEVLAAYYEAKLNGENFFLLKWLIDPSGYVYEAVLPNRIKGAKLTIYYKESEDGAAVLWDASEYSQQNPLYSDSEGYYAWDVPEGWWQVVCELEGYQTWTSEWMTVPPIRTDVNVGLVSQKTPEISSLEIHKDGAAVIFDKYMIPDTADDMVLLNEEGEKIAYTLEYRTDEASPEGTVYAKRFKLIPADMELTDGESYIVTIPNTVLSYAGSAVRAQSMTELCVPDISLTVPENLTVKYGERVTIPVTVEPADAEIQLTAQGSSADFVKIISLEKMETKGLWNVTVEGRLPGQAYINFGAHGLEYNLEAAVTIEMNHAFAGFEDESFVPVELTACEVQPVADMTWTGKEMTPKLTVTYEGAVLTEGTDYVVTYSDNIQVGTAKAVLKGIGNYTGELVITFRIVKAECRHAYQKVTVAAACETDGREYEICKLCQEVKPGSEKTLPAPGHSYGAYVITKEATALAEGTQVRTCGTCGSKESAAIAKLTPTITVNAETLPLKIKQSFKALKVTGLAKGDYVKTWVSSDTAVFTVTGKEDGSCVIKAGKKPKKSAVLTITLASGLTKTVAVTTQKKTVKTKSITGLSSTLTLQKGDSFTLNPILNPLTSGQKISYSSSDKKTATVSKTGVITAKKAGKATITVKSGSKKIKIRVTVPKTATEEITGVPAELTLKRGRSYSLKAKLLPKNSDYGLTYKTSSKKVAVVSTKGKITAKKKGTAVITVKSGSVSVQCKVTVR